MKTSHKDLCNKVDVNQHMLEALEEFLLRTINAKREEINRLDPRSRTSSLRTDFGLIGGRIFNIDLIAAISSL